MSKQSQYYVELFGSAQIFKDGHLLNVSRKRVRALLFYLVAEAKPVSRSQMAYLLWPDKEYAAASQNLSIYLSYLKSELGGELVLAQTNTISISPDIDSDLRRFQELSASSDLTEILQALQLYHGPFLSGFSLQNAYPFEQWTMEQVSFWNNQFVEKSTLAADLLIRAQRYDEAIQVLEAACRCDPMNEELCCLQMTALGLSGRRNAVTRVYQELIALLNRELGLLPSQETSDCYRQIISSESGPPLDDAPGVPQLSIHQEMIFVGRQALLQAMAAGNSNHFVLIQGKSGMGKTRLVNAYIKRNHLFHIDISFKQQEQTIPYFAIIKFIRGLILDSQHRDEIVQISRQLLENRWEVLCQLVPELGQSRQPRSLGAVITIQQIMEALEQFLLCLTGQRKSIIFIDDIHYADTSSLEVLQYLICQPSLAHIQFFATFRQSLSQPHIIAFFNVLLRENILQTLELGKLEDENMLELLLHYYPDIDPDVAENLIRMADGNPFWMRTIINGLDSGYTEISGNKSLKDLFSRALNSLSNEARTVVFAMAIIGESCEPGLFSSICDSVPADRESIRAELFRANLFSRDSDGTLRFSHSKIYEYIFSLVNTNTQQVRSLHFFIARAMENAYGEQANGQQLIALTDHFRQSDQPKLCAPYAARAGSYMLSIDNPQEALRCFKLAFSYSELPAKFDLVLLMHPLMMQLGQNYEASIYLDRVRDLALDRCFREYELTFSAMSVLCRCPEYMEIYLGVSPCYKLPVDRNCEALLLEARSLLTGEKSNPFLNNQILRLLSIFYIISGEYDNALDTLWQIIGQNLVLSDHSDVVTTILLYTSLRDVILLMNQSPGQRTEEVIELEKQLYNSSPLQGMLANNLGTQALLKNLQGKTEEGANLMNTCISEARRSGNKIALANMLATQAMLIRRTAPEKSYSMNFEAYTLSRELNAKYTLVRALTGLVITCSSRTDAEHYYDELERLIQQLGCDSPPDKLETAKRALQNKDFR